MRWKSSTHTGKLIGADRRKEGCYRVVELRKRKKHYVTETNVKYRIGDGRCEGCGTFPVWMLDVETIIQRKEAERCDKS